MKQSFYEIKLSASKSGLCPVCGKYSNRSKTFSQTVSPFNRNQDGSEKTVPEVKEAVMAEIRAWVPDFTHGKCK